MATRGLRGKTRGLRQRQQRSEGRWWPDNMRSPSRLSEFLIPDIYAMGVMDYRSRGWEKKRERKREVKEITSLVCAAQCERDPSTVLRSRNDFYSRNLNGFKKRDSRVKGITAESEDSLKYFDANFATINKENNMFLIRDTWEIIYDWDKNAMIHFKFFIQLS